MNDRARLRHRHRDTDADRNLDKRTNTRTHEDSEQAHGDRHTHTRTQRDTHRHGTETQGSAHETHRLGQRFGAVSHMQSRPWMGSDCLCEGPKEADPERASRWMGKAAPLPGQPRVDQSRCQQAGCLCALVCLLCAPHASQAPSQSQACPHPSASRLAIAISITFVQREH